MGLFWVDMSDSDQDTSQVVVQTYVPAYQRNEWDEHAGDLDMSRSEFVRTMVQAGRRGFGEDEDGDLHDGVDANPQDESMQRENELKPEILKALQNDPVSWEELIERIVGDIESQVETTLKELEDADKLRYSGPKGGYVLTTETEQ